MALNYKAVQSNMPDKDGNKLWFPKLVLQIDSQSTKDIASQIAEKSSLSRGDVYNVLDNLISEMAQRLMNGYQVKLDGLGTFIPVASASGNGVKTPQEVNASQIKSLHIRFTPAYKRSRVGGITSAMFANVKFQRWKGDPYRPGANAKDNEDENADE